MEELGSYFFFNFLFQFFIKSLACSFFACLPIFSHIIASFFWSAYASSSPISNTLPILFYLDQIASLTPDIFLLYGLGTSNMIIVQPGGVTSQARFCF